LQAELSATQVALEQKNREAHDLLLRVDELDIFNREPSLNDVLFAICEICTPPDEYIGLEVILPIVLQKLKNL
jgi:hypothetical protein